MNIEAELQINCTRNGKIEINEDESYRLTVTSKNSNRILHLGAFAWFGNTIAITTKQQYFLLLSIVEISDAPRFTWRTLMIDAARHFQPVDVIKKS
jgi:hexosaminidase